MYLYKFGYSSPEDSVYIELQHEDKFSDEEFENIIVEATVEVLINNRPEWTKDFYVEEGVPAKEEIKRKTKFYKKMAKKYGYDKIWVEKSVKKHFEESSYLKFSDITDEMENTLINMYGFKAVKYEAIFTIFGWQDLVNKNDYWYDGPDTIFDKIREEYKVKKLKLQPL